MSIEQVRDHHISKVNRSVENQPVAARSGARILVDALRTYNARFAFCVPGESYLAVLDALYDVRDELKLIVCRQEGGVGFMAEAYGKVTGTPGIALVTRAPGALNASIGVHTAFQDSTPMILLIGQVTRAMMEREAFQEIDYRRIFSPIAKWVAQIDDVNRIPEFISRAYHVAMSGRRGPVVLALPEDVLSASATVVDGQCYKVARAYPGDSDMAKLQELLSQAQRPLMILGGSGWTRSACQDIERFATNYYLPVACSFRRQDLFNNDSPNYVGDVGIGINPKLAEMIKRTDLLIVVGARLGEMASSGYTLLAIPRPVQTLVHVHPGAEELGRVYQSDLPVHANMDAFAERVAQMAAPISCAWREWTDGAHAGYMKQSEPITQPFAVDMGAIIATLRRALPRNAILTNGAGNYAAWAHRYYRFSEFGTQIAPTSGSMGYGLPAAIAAKLAAPERTVICLSGDGCF